MQNQIPDFIRSLMQKFLDKNFQIYIVGGAVRDLFLKREGFDWDFTTDAKPEQILELFPEGFYDNKFGTVGISCDFGVIEVTTMRKEGDYHDRRHPVDVSWTDKLEEDLTRRDFTINAMALDINGKLTDVYGGIKDLDSGLIRAVRDPVLRFNEDALRMLKAFRLVSQLNFEIEDSTFESIKKLKVLILEVAWERIRDEFFKLLAGDNPYLALVLMKDSGMLELILPEVTKCFDVKQEGPKHDRTYDVGEHSFLTLKETPSKDPVTLLAALLHDIGKAETINVQGDGNVTFYNHDLVGGNLVLKIAKRFNLSKKQTDKLFKLVRWHLFTVDENQTDSAIRRFIKNVGVENLDDMMALRIGDRLGGGTQKAISWRMEEFQKRIKQVLTKPFSISDLKINGKDIMETLNIPPGPKVGEILQKLFEEVLEDDSKNNKEYLLSKIKELN